MNVITFELFLIYPCNLNSGLIIYIIHVSDEFGTGALDLDHQCQIGLQTSFEKKLNQFLLQFMLSPRYS